jgi:site-specific recombinase XerD
VANKRLRAAGINLPRLGAHLLRHTTAWRLLTDGFAFKAIGDYLGHSAASSTSIYLKIDLVGLSEVAINDGEELV